MKGAFLADILAKSSEGIASLWYSTEDGMTFTDSPAGVTKAVENELREKLAPSEDKILPTEEWPEWFRHKCVPKAITLGEEELNKDWKRTRNKSKVEEFNAYLLEMSDGKSAGISGVAIDLFKNGSDKLKDLLKLCVDLILVWSLKMDVLTDFNIWFIQKGADQCVPDVSKLRPIALRESLLKLVSGIVDKRVNAILTKYDLCHHNQRGFVNNGSTEIPLQVMASVLNDAKVYDKELHLAPMDIKAAYDKLPFSAVLEGYKRMHAPPEFLELKQAIGQHGRCRGMTQCGTTAFINRKNGLPQGDPSSPTDWVVAFDSILCIVDDMGGGYEVTRGTGSLPLRVMAYADDITVFGKSHSDLQEKVRRVCEWCLLWGMSVSESKSFYVCRMPEGRNDDKILEIKHLSSAGRTTTLINSRPIKEPFKYLGVYYELDLSWTKEGERCWDETVHVYGCYCRAPIRRTSSICVKCSTGRKACLHPPSSGRSPKDIRKDRHKDARDYFCSCGIYKKGYNEYGGFSYPGRRKI
eukprot:Lithocolla_globosa_v1_NODE_254_length_4813_cov_30.378310.p2 type:complete len:524 gc:universal NODE_254_length_4813_cov_30.378310:3907-2336(-)